MTEETHSANAVDALCCSVHGEKCDRNCCYNTTQRDCQCEDENSLTEHISQDTDLELSHEHSTKTKKKVSFSDQILVYELKNEYKCEKCFETFKDYLTLRRHIQRKHKKQKHYICYYCAKKIVNRDLFKVHIKLHCDVCSLLLPNRCQYLKHKENICRIGEEHNVKEMALGEHLNTFNTCELCKKQFSSKCALKYHISNNHLNKSIIDLKSNFESAVTMYSCPYCKESSICEEKINEHLGLLPDANDNEAIKQCLHECNQCDEKFDIQNDLLDHKRSHNINLQNDSSQMEISDAVSMNNFPDHQLRKKIDIKNGVPDHFNPRVLLERLDINFFSLQSDDKGNESSDENSTVGDLLIENCNSNISNSSGSSLSVHLKLTDFQCEVCQKYYCSNYNLQRHLKTHENKKCIFCGKEFLTRSRLNEHQCNIIPKIPAADERVVVSLDDLNKLSPEMKERTETTITVSNKNKPIIIEVRSLNASYNILKEIEMIKIKKFNVMNEVPYFFQPKVLVERMDFDHFYPEKTELTEDFDDVIYVGGVEDAEISSVQENMLKIFNKQKHMETLNIFQTTISNDTNNHLLHVNEDICNSTENNHEKKDNISKPQVGSIRVIKNTTANFIDTMDYQDEYLKSVRQWSHGKKSSQNTDNSLNRIGNKSEVRTYTLKLGPVNTQSAPNAMTSHNEVNHDITDDIPVTILKKVNPTSASNPVCVANALPAPNYLLNKEQSPMSGPPRLLNHELNDSPNLSQLQGNGQKWNSGQIAPGEVFHLQPASMIIVTDSNKVQLQPGYLLRMNNEQGISKDTHNRQVIPETNRGQDEAIRNGKAGFTKTQNSIQTPYLLNEQFASSSRDREKSISDGPILREILGTDNETVDPLHNRHVIPVPELNHDQDEASRYGETELTRPRNSNQIHYLLNKESVCLSSDKEDSIDGNPVLEEILRTDNETVDPLNVEQVVSIPELNQGGMEATRNGETGLTRSQNSNQTHYVSNEQLASLPNDKEKIVNNNPMLQEMLRTDNKIVDPLHNNRQVLTNAGSISTMLTTNSQRMSMESIPESVASSTTQLVLHMFPTAVPNDPKNPNINIASVLPVATEVIAVNTNAASVLPGAAEVIAVNTNTASVLPGATELIAVNVNTSPDSQVCENNFSTHNDSITSVITMSFDCKICNKYFHGKSSLSQHLRKMHKLAADYSPLIYICNVCDEAFVKRYNLQRHRCMRFFSQNKRGALNTYSNRNLESQNSVANITNEAVIDLTDSYNQSNGCVPNGINFLDGNTALQNLNSIDIEVPIHCSTHETVNQDVAVSVDAQVPVVSTTSYEYDNYKLVFTEVPIEF